MLSLQTLAARPYTVLFASSTASRGVRNVIGRQHWAENFLLRHGRMSDAHCSGASAGKTIRAMAWQAKAAANTSRLPQSPAARAAEFDQLHARHDRADIDGFVERRPDAQRAHPLSDFADQRLRDALLH